MKRILGLAICFGTLNLSAQTYLSERTGSNTDFDVEPDFGLCLMGGAGESDQAMTWFLEKANGGDVLVIREGSIGGYNNYMFSELGVTLNSVETIAFQSEEAATDPYVLQRLAEAEAIWMAGGDQGEYVDFWKDTPVMDAINDLLNVRGGALGGISAGMAVMAQVYFPALLGTVTSEEVLADPLDNSVLLGYDDFIEAPWLEGVITETHFNDPDRIRYGRVMGFMARTKFNYEISPRGIASNEYCAVTINADGIARAWGEFPAFDDDYVYFLQENPANTQGPEIMEQDVPLTWIRDEEAVKVYKVEATVSGENFFDLNDWATGDGGEWQDWWVDQGELFMAMGDPLSSTEIEKASFSVFPNPTVNQLSVEGYESSEIDYEISTLTGQTLLKGTLRKGEKILTDELSEGLYLLRLTEDEPVTIRFTKIR